MCIVWPTPERFRWKSLKGSWETTWARMGSSKKYLLAMPDDVIDVFGFAFHLAQAGKKHDQAKPMKRVGRGESALFGVCVSTDIMIWGLG